MMVLAQKRRTARLFWMLAVSALAAAIPFHASADELDVRSVIPELQLKDGQTLRNVKFVDYGATLLMARWDGGRGTISYDTLPDDWMGAVRSYLRPKVEPTIIKSISPEPDPTPGSPIRISGQCFVVIKGNQTYKLSSVEIAVYPEAAWETYQKQVDQIAADQKKQLDDKFEATISAARRTDLGDLKGMTAADDAMAAAANAVYILPYDKWNVLPQPLASTTTDTDGRFSLTHTVVPPYVVFARAKRSVGDRDELYTWVLPSSKINDLSNIFLSNENLAE